MRSTVCVPKGLPGSSFVSACADEIDTLPIFMGAGCIYFKLEDRDLRNVPQKQNQS
jgi:hypothetical protein